MLSLLCFFTLTLVKRLGIAFFFCSHFFGFTQSFQILVTILYILSKKVIFSKFSDFLVTIFVLLFLKLRQRNIPNIIQHISCATLVQKFKIASLSWNLVLKLIWICRIQWRCSRFLFFTRNTLFRQIWPKKTKLSV